MSSQADVLSLYVSETGAIFACRDARLAGTTERHKLALHAVPPALQQPLDAVLADQAGVSGVIVELKRGWAGPSRLRLARRVLRRGLRVWWYWPAEEVVECVDRERLSSAWRHVWIISFYFKVIVPWRGIRSRLRPAARYIIRGTPPEPPIIKRALDDIAARLESVSPVALPPGPLGRGVYLRTDFWAVITSGGSYGHTCYVAKELAAAGDGLVCLMPQRYSLLDHFGIPQIVMTPPASDPVSENDLARATAYYYPIVKAAIEAVRPQYVYERLVLGNYTGASLSRDLGLPYIVEYNGSEISMRRSFDGQAYIHEEMYLKAEELAFAQATAISVVSDEIKSSLVGRGVPEAKIVVNPNGVDLDAYRPPDAAGRAAVRAELGFGAGDRVIGFTGTFGGWHGVDVLAAAMPQICDRAPDARFLLIGDGNYKHLVDDVIARHGLAAKVRAVGRVPQAEGARLLRACDICVSPHSSHMVDSKFFGSPTKIFEYMAMGAGIVASDLEQIGQVLSPALRPAAVTGDVVVKDERAVLCTPGDVAEFVDAVVALVAHPAAASELGRNAREAAVQGYSWTTHVNRLVAFVAGLPAARSAGREHLAAPAVAVSDRYKEQTQLQWDNDPAGSHYVKDSEPHTLQWFQEAEAYRYGEYAPWMADTMEFARHRGERVLEIGGGMGTDLAQFARHGAAATDVDLSSGHLSLARENFTLRGLHGEFVLHDAERLPFANSWFDLVYSNGVLHHTPNTRGVVEEILRVLKPGGRAIVMMYAENSLHYWRNLVWAIGLKEAQLLEQSMGEIMSRAVERSDNAAARPLVKVYTKERLRRLFDGFDDIEIVQRQMVRAEMPRLLARVPVSWLGTLMGWNLIIKARKPRAPGVRADREDAPAETTPASGRP